MAIEVHQCPYCELRFATKWELESHIDETHPERERENERENDDDRKS